MKFGIQAQLNPTIKVRIEPEPEVEPETEVGPEPEVEPELSTIYSSPNESFL